MLLAAPLALSLFVAAAQQPDEVRVSAHSYTPPQLRLTATTQLVQIEVVVRDRNGHSIGGLLRSDFEIMDEGKLRQIAAFSEVRAAGAAPAATPLPASATSSPTPAPAAAPLGPHRSTLLFFDDLHASPADLQRTQVAAEGFIKQGLGRGRAAVYSASDGMVLDFTADPAVLSAAVAKLRPHQRISDGGLQPCPRISPYQAYLIANHLDESALAAAFMEAQPCLGGGGSGGARGGRTILLPGTNIRIPATDPALVAVQAQAEQTWEQVRTISLTTFDALHNAMAVLARAPGSRVLLLVSTGFLSGMLDAERAAAIDFAIHGNIVVNALDAKGLWAEPPARPFDDISRTASLPLPTFVFETQSVGARMDAQNAIMADLAAGTGGLFFHNSNDLTGGFAQLALVPESTYLIAFRPEPAGTQSRYRKLKVRLAAKDHGYVQARPGYMAAPAEAPPAIAKMDRAILAQDVLSEIPVQLGGRISKTEKGEPVLALVIHVDIAKLKFTSQGDRQNQKLTFIAALTDAHGNMAAAKEGCLELALTPTTKARLTRLGVDAQLTLGAPPGPYYVRAVVQDAEGKMAAVTQKVLIR
jgi:VWFA-related protein